MGTLRTSETEAKYRAVKASGVMNDACPLCDERTSVKDFEHWRVIENLYPYDLVAKVHHMLVSKRHASDMELTDEEWEEFRSIKAGYVQEEYEFMIEPTWKQKSIPAHSHLHLLVAMQQ